MNDDGNWSYGRYDHVAGKRWPRGGNGGTSASNVTLTPTSAVDLDQATTIVDTISNPETVFIFNSKVVVVSSTGRITEIARA